ncbi:MAG: DUF4169 family protein [Parvularculaceae bacterium]|nr:DUF4169 family protein [Parvularculaceae bacterium]
MAEIINLNRARKNKKRTQKEKQAAENRVKFGKTKSEKQKQRADDNLAKARIDGHKLERED